ncbi:competence type IV pilus major pilin ComGC [Peribacillus loiseleuriae]|uniref:competence type IV pilus major pilin ComGC n=1 Tax=Peribacillus loiseleuriae TaxID=1679170 RepID=UPI003D093B36
MMKRVKALMNNQKGLTLVELLAVIVILGIIAAIAVPSIGKIIDNSKKDAHLANAQQMVSSARLAVAANDKKLWTINTNGGVATTENQITLEKLISEGYIESTLKDPDGGDYIKADSFVKITEKNGEKTYSVYLVGTKRMVGKANEPVDPTNIDRDDVIVK